MPGLLEQLDRLAQKGMLAPKEIRVSQDQWDQLVRLGLAEPKVIPASKVRLALLGRLAQQEPLEQRVRRGLKEIQDRRDRKA